MTSVEMTLKNFMAHSFYFGIEIDMVLDFLINYSKKCFWICDKQIIT